MIGRREFIALLGGAAVLPVAARAQQATRPVIGWLNNTSAQGYAAPLAAFRQGLQETGFVEGRNVAIEYRWGDDQYDQLPAMAADLVRRQVTVIAAGGRLAAQAAKAATTTIPIVFNGGFDPVANGLIASLNRPGGNLTGVTTLGTEVGPKRLELLHELVPTATSIALLVNPATRAAETQTRDMQEAARSLGLELQILHASAERDFDSVFSTLLQQRAGGLVISNSGLFLNRSEQLAALAIRHAVPTIFEFREFAAAGGLMSYGGDTNTTGYSQVGIYTGRILKGEKPADLPVQQATKVELVINMRTAKALGLTIPITLLGRADEVIE
jgi:putative tryptophan/tyrosine transport system substrate-binding protein